MTIQELFDIGVRGVRAQGVLSRDECEDECCYRHPRDPHIRCVVGHLISDEEYRLEMEGKGVHVLHGEGLLPARLVPHVDFLVRLQEAHDGAGKVDEFLQYAAKLAMKHGLDPQEAL